jgi:hypothetical protein
VRADKSESENKSFILDACGNNMKTFLFSWYYSPLLCLRKDTAGYFHHNKKFGASSIYEQAHTKPHPNANANLYFWLFIFRGRGKNLKPGLNEMTVRFNIIALRWKILGQGYMMTCCLFCRQRGCWRISRHSALFFLQKWSSLSKLSHAITFAQMALSSWE